MKIGGRPTFWIAVVFGWVVIAVGLRFFKSTLD